MLSAANYANSDIPQRAVNGSGASGLRPFLADATQRRLAPREHAFYEGDEGSHIYRIERGIMTLYRLLPDGRRQIICFKFPGDLIGFEAREQRTCGAEAVTEAELRCLPMHIASQRLRQDASVGVEVVELLAAELADARNQLAVLNRRSAMEKLAAFIVDLWRREAPRQGACLALHISRSDMADFLGLTVETISRSLTKLKLKRIIALPEAHRLVILDMGRLEGLSTGEALD